MIGLKRRAAGRLLSAGLILYLLAGCQTGNERSPSVGGDGALAGEETTMIVVRTGDRLDALRTALGPPSEQHELRNDNPSSLGARTLEYALSEPVIGLDMNGSERRVANVMFVLDPEGQVIRILENPNPFGPADQRQTRGAVGIATEARVPNAPELVQRLD